MSAIFRIPRVERYIGPDATITLDFALVRAAGVIDKLIVYPERMKENLDRTRGLVHTPARAAGADASGHRRARIPIAWCRSNAMRAWNGEGTLLDLLKADKDVTKALPQAQARKAVRPRLSPQTRRYDFRAGVWVVLAATPA